MLNLDKIDIFWQIKILHINKYSKSFLGFEKNTVQNTHFFSYL